VNVKHLSQPELAERWALSPYTLERWRHQGLGPVFLKINGRVVYRLADIEAYEARCLRASTSTAVSQTVMAGGAA